jgi:hypothetical protein
MSSYPTRIAAILALEEAIEAYHGYTGPGPGRWIVDMPGRFFIALTWNGQHRQPQTDLDNERPWREFGGEVIMNAAKLTHCRILTGEAGDGSHFSSAIILVQG